jgi:hypothetical protein
MKKKRMIMKKSDLYENFEKRGGSREKGGGGNEIHAPCACDLNMSIKRFLDCN